ncbi:MAG TPA: TlpA disulfide reductase family protein [Phenylobacterium sp.]|jgi:thiol-disulfide isomerase/thioredoxin|uniref:TlpA family protein disulfide reductase n=1 Tax=Phenylobacterium sp. TaxID=1871053 RepID=UPI002D4205E6|nr:TlpA disulfide reductase family protein [Phenylobacterium sp.]HZZ67087.1 TlpA disulfide reductase family protein [Phenylobacterium sp.]
MNEESAAKPRGGVLKWALWGAAAIGVAAVVYIIGQSSTKPVTKTEVATSGESSGGSSGAVATAPATHDVSKKLSHVADGTAPPAYPFFDANGKKLVPADFKGKVVVMNVWATWCGPCKTEMPTLAKLAQEYAGKPVAVVAVSIDKPDALAAAKAFIAANAPLKLYNDPEAKLPWQLKPNADGMPTTLILGKDGLERGRISGEADWSGPGAKHVIDKVLAE